MYRDKSDQQRGGRVLGRQGHQGCRFHSGEKKEILLQTEVSTRANILPSIRILLNFRDNVTVDVETNQGTNKVIYRVRKPN